MFLVEIWCLDHDLDIVLNFDVSMPGISTISLDLNASPDNKVVKFIRFFDFESSFFLDFILKQGDENLFSSFWILGSILLDHL